MCGLVGIIHQNKKVQKNDLKYLNNLQHHRGPDEEGYFFCKNNNLGMAMKRLSIIGIDSGSQPKISEDCKKVIFFNGEIFNYKQLAKQYLNQNINSDSQVILNLYEKFGINFLSKLNGMFVIVIYDKILNQLTIIRDRFGIKPIYFYYDGKSFVYSSEITPLRFFLNSNQLEEQAISNYFTLGYAYNDDKTIYKNIYKIKQGFLLKLDLNSFSLSKKQWWKFKPIKKIFKNTKHYFDHAENCIIESLKNWTNSDVPISFMLSGGLDSGLLAGIYTSIHKKKLNTFSMSFIGNNYKKWDETKTIKDFVNTYDSNHQNIIFNLEDIKKDIFKIISSLEEPYGGGIPSWFLLKEIKKKFKVTISGIGGDELFGNYNRFLRMKEITRNYYNKKNFYKYYFFNNFYKVSNDFKKKYTNLDLSYLDKTEDLFFDILINRKNKLSPAKNFSFLDYNTQLTDEFLFFSDRFSMRNSVELRTPYLDHNLIESIYGYPEHIRTNKNQYKPILREIAKKYLPNSYLSQPKMGFSIPLSLIMRGNMKKITQYYLSPIILKNVGYLKENFINDFLIPFFKGDNRNVLLIWNFLMFHIWFIEFHKKNINISKTF